MITKSMGDIVVLYLIITQPPVVLGIQVFQEMRGGHISAIENAIYSQYHLCLSKLLYHPITREEQAMNLSHVNGFGS